MLNNNCGEEHRYKTSSFLFFLKNTKPKKQKKDSYLKLFKNGANKNEADNITTTKK